MIDLGRMRWLLFEQLGSSLSTPFLVVLVFRLAVRPRRNLHSNDKPVRCQPEMVAPTSQPRSYAMSREFAKGFWAD